MENQAKAGCGLNRDEFPLAGAARLGWVRFAVFNGVGILLWAGAGIGAGMLLFPPVTQLLLDAWGWRATHRILGIVSLACLPLVMALPLGRIAQGSSEWQAARATAAAWFPDECVTTPAATTAM